ncbi:MAG TPA: nuclear transport factor 2 family protein [Terriglobales bacterium]|nr:nuclear transport factor 2 family protein [Terriglobales bacterium]
MSSLSIDEVRAEVTRFWNVFTSKASDLLEEFYAPDASVFASSSARSEPGRLAVARRKREYFDKQSSVRVQVGYIEVQLLSDDAAVASYTFQFHANRIAAGAGNAVEEDIQHGRATQVFLVDSDHKLRIVHEHFSVSAD